VMREDLCHRSLDVRLWVQQVLEERDSDITSVVAQFCQSPRFSFGLVVDRGSEVPRDCSRLLDLSPVRWVLSKEAVDCRTEEGLNRNAKTHHFPFQSIMKVEIFVERFRGILFLKPKAPIIE